MQSYMGLVRDTSAGGNVWQMDKDLGADEDDGTFNEASPVDDSAADDDDVVSFPVGKTASTGIHVTHGTSSTPAHRCFRSVTPMSGWPQEPLFPPGSCMRAAAGHLRATVVLVCEGCQGLTASWLSGVAQGPSLDAQAAARAEFNVEKADAFYSSDEDDAQSSAAASDIGGLKFKVLTRVLQMHCDCAVPVERPATSA